LQRGLIEGGAFMTLKPFKVKHRLILDYSREECIKRLQENIETKILRFYNDHNGFHIRKSRKAFSLPPDRANFILRARFIENESPLQLNIEFSIVDQLILLVGIAIIGAFLIIHGTNDRKMSYIFMLPVAAYFQYLMMKESIQSGKECLKKVEEILQPTVMEEVD
jgi:hypothetical protein